MPADIGKKTEILVPVGVLEIVGEPLRFTGLWPRGWGAVNSPRAGTSYGSPPPRPSPPSAAHRGRLPPDHLAADAAGPGGSPARPPAAPPGPCPPPARLARAAPSSPPRPAARDSAAPVLTAAPAPAARAPAPPSPRRAPCPPARLPEGPPRDKQTSGFAKRNGEPRRWHVAPGGRRRPGLRLGGSRGANASPASPVRRGGASAARPPSPRTFQGHTWLRAEGAWAAQHRDCKRSPVANPKAK